MARRSGFFVGFSGGDDDDDVIGFGGRRRGEHVPVPTWLIGTLVVLAGIVGLSLITGFPGPGALRRYPVSELNDVADRINRAADSAPTSPVSTRPAEVDLVTSRVRVSVTADVCSLGLSSGQLEMIEVKGSGDTPSCGLG